MVGTARDVFVIAVADVFISSFNDNGANKQSQIKINLLHTFGVRAFPRRFVNLATSNAAAPCIPFCAENAAR
jgi:hypothetical protein